MNRQSIMARVRKGEGAYHRLPLEQQEAFRWLYTQMARPAMEAPARLNHAAFQQWYWSYPIDTRGCSLRVRQLVCTRLWGEVGVNGPAAGWQPRASQPGENPRAEVSSKPAARAVQVGVKGEDGITRYPEAPRVSYAKKSSAGPALREKAQPERPKRDIAKLAKILAKKAKRHNGSI